MKTVRTGQLKRKVFLAGNTIKGDLAVTNVDIETLRKRLLFLGHRSLIRNKTQTAVINIINLRIFI